MAKIALLDLVKFAPRLSIANKVVSILKEDLKKYLDVIFVSSHQKKMTIRRMNKSPRMTTTIGDELFEKRPLVGRFDAREQSLEQSQGFRDLESRERYSPDGSSGFRLGGVQRAGIQGRDGHKELWVE